MRNKTAVYQIFKGLFIFLLAAHIVGVLILDSVPPVSIDALIYHLEIPRLYLQHGGVYEIPGNPFSYYPMNLGLLYMIPLFFGNDIAPKYIHFFFALGTAFLIAAYLRSRLNGLYGLAGALFFLTVPLIVKLSAIVYADLGLIFFSTLALLMMIEWSENRFRFKYLALSAISAGLGAGTKYTGLIGVLCMAPLAVQLYRKGNPESRRPFIKGLGAGVVFCLTAALIVSPWLIRNAVWTGNPVYPTYNRIFNPETKSDKIPLVSGTLFESRRDMFNESLPEILLLPVRVFFEGEDGNPRLFDGVLSPFLFILPFFAWFESGRRSVSRKEKAVFLYFVIFIFGYFLFTTNMTQLRLIGPVIPGLVILSVFGVHEIINMAAASGTRFKTYAGYTAVAVLLIALGLIHGQYIFRQFQLIQPVPYLLGEISRDQYIERYRPEYPAMRYINERLPDQSKILGLLIGYRGYYCERPISFWEADPLFYAVINAKSPRMLLHFFQREGADYFIIWFRHFEKWSQNNFRPFELLNIDAFFSKHTELLFSRNGYRVYRLVD